MRTVSAQAMASFYSESGGYSLPILLSITHGVAGYTNPLLIVNNTVDLDYDGDTYVAFPFKFDPPDTKNDGSIQSARITISAIDQTIAGILRSTSVPPTVTAIAMYYSDETGTEVFEPLATFNLTLRNVTGNADSISGDLIYEDRLELEFPVDEFRPTGFPGLF